MKKKPPDNSPPPETMRRELEKQGLTVFRILREEDEWPYVSKTRSWIAIIIMTVSGPLSAMALGGVMPKLPMLDFVYHFWFAVLLGALTGIFLWDDFLQGLKARALPFALGTAGVFLAVYFYFTWMLRLRTLVFQAEVLIPIALGCLPGIAAFYLLKRLLRR